MPGHRLEIGEHGDIFYREGPAGITAAFYYRDHQGQRRRVQATADSKAAARRLALTAMERALSSGPSGEYTRRTTFAEVAERWLQHVYDLVAAGQRSPTTAALYRSVLDVHVLPALGRLRLAEVTTGRMDQFLHKKRRDSGYAVAKLSRSVSSGICGLATRHGAMQANPVRDAGRLESRATPARALTAEECTQWLMILDTDAQSRSKDLPDLVRFLLGTGVRLGEALGVGWEDVDLDRRIIYIRRTIIRVKGQGLVAKPPKTLSGVRTLGVPVWLTDLLRTRKRTADLAAPIFPDSVGGYRDLNNVERAFRHARTGTPFEWVVPHTYRKTVATFLDREGLSARTIADQLGHSRISMTQDVYLGRGAVDSAAAMALESLFPRDDPDDPPHLAIVR